MRFKDLLQQLREKAGLTQTTLSESSGIPLGSIRNYEQGHRIPSWPAVVRMANAIGVSADAFSKCDEVKEEVPAPKKPAKRKGK